MELKLQLRANSLVSFWNLCVKLCPTLPMQVQSRHSCTLQCRRRHSSNCLQWMPCFAVLSARCPKCSMCEVPHDHSGKDATQYFVFTSMSCQTRNEAHITPRLQVPVYGHLTCGGCSTVLMYPIGAHSVKCSACQHITPAGAAPRVGGNARAAGAGAGPSNPGTRGAPLVQTVVVENPCSLDEEGNEVSEHARSTPGIAYGRDCLVNIKYNTYIICALAYLCVACVNEIYGCLLLLLA